MAETVEQDGAVKRYNVNLTVGGEVYGFHVTPEDEELLRRAGAMLNARMMDLSRFEFKDSMQHLATAALQCMMLFLKEKKQDVSGTLIREIRFFDKQLGDYIDKERLLTEDKA